jgi:hypothetical protein
LADTTSNRNNDRSIATSVILGLAVGIAFVLVFSVLMTGNIGNGSLGKSSSPLLSSAASIVETNGTLSSSSTNQHTQEAVLERGNIVMGFDQNKIMHHFMATSTGGRIMIVALNSSDSETIKQIKDHVIDIQYEFSQANFTKPFFIHDQQVPGTDIMAMKKDLIIYGIEQLNNGAVLVLTTDDKELQNAINQFMQFQGIEHKGH